MLLLNICTKYSLVHDVQVVTVPGTAADTFIQKTKKLYLDTRTQRNLNKLTADVHEVTNIMTKNIQDILGQGEKMDSTLPYLFPYMLLCYNTSRYIIAAAPSPRQGCLLGVSPAAPPFLLNGAASQVRSCTQHLCVPL